VSKLTTVNICSVVVCYVCSHLNVCSYINAVKNVINLFNKYDACVGDVIDTDVIFCKFADLCRLKCVG